MAARRNTSPPSTTSSRKTMRGSCLIPAHGPRRDPRSGGALRSEAHRQFADGVDEIVRRHFDAAGIFDIRQPRQQLAIDFLQLELRHALADADMRAEPEGDVLRRI